MLQLSWPPQEPEPGPGDLGADIDWMTYSHRELYDMVHDGLDLAGATAVAAQWAKIGQALDEIGDGLRQAVQNSIEDWQGAAADKARGTVGRLVDWTADTADRGRKVAGCVSLQADNAETARRTMPEPPPPAENVAYPAASTDFSSAAVIARDPEPDLDEAQQSHQQAAAVMTRFQRDSNEIFGTVPAFTKPLQQDTRKTDGPPATQPGPDKTVAAGAVPVAAPAAGNAGSGGISLGPGERTGLVERQPATQPAAGGPGTSASRGGTAPAGMPMTGTGAGRRREEDAEHRRPSYLQEDGDFWHAGINAVPPVIGE